MPFHRTIYRYADADWDSFRTFIADSPRHHIFKRHPTKVTSLITDRISEGMNLFIPHKKYQQKPGSQPWFTPGCAAAIAHRNHYFHLYNSNRDKETKAAYRQSSNRCSRILKDAKESYKSSIKNKIEEQTLGSKEFWKITKKILNPGKSSIPTIVNGPEILPSASDKASLFAEMFSKNSTLDDSNVPLPDFPLRTDKKLCDAKIAACDVEFFICDLSVSKATGPGDIPVIVLKNIAPELSPILEKLFNLCIKRKCFPSIWKESSVCPVYKNKGERSDPSNYRPISLLSIISKVFESTINKHLKNYLGTNLLLIDSQYGFRSSRSTADVLTVITDRISRTLDKGFDARAIALDISKAFDKVWHKGLLLKLSSYGVSGHILGIIKSFLSGRSLRVVINGQSSKMFFLNAGVPQGSVLGPTLFLIFINDLLDNVLKSFVNIFADDTTNYGVTSKNYSHNNLCDDLSHDLSEIVKWGNEWLVSFNTSKTNLVSFHHHRSQEFTLPPILMNDVELEEKSCLDRLIGLKLTSDLKWNAYIVEVAKNVSKMIGSFYRSKKYLTPESILYLYKSQIRPKMEYCCHIWAGYSSTSLSILDRLQRRIKGLIGDELFSTLHTLSHRRDVASLTLFYRYFYGKCSDELHSLVPPLWNFGRRTRFAFNSHPFFLRIPFSRTKFHADSFFQRTASL